MSEGLARSLLLWMRQLLQSKSMPEPFPSSLDHWSLELILRLCEVGHPETDRYDFKFGLPDSEGLTKLCCAFANSVGGFVIVGVRENGRCFQPVGVSPDREIAQQFGSKIRADPTIVFEGPRAISMKESSSLIYIFHIPPSVEAPHLPSDAAKRIFWKRTNAGCEQMTRMEIQAAFVRYEERRQRLGLLLIELRACKERLQQGLRRGPDVLAYVSFDATLIEQVLVDSYSIIHRVAELEHILFALREELRSVRLRSDAFYLEVASLPQALKPNLRTDVIRRHNAAMADHAHRLIPRLDEAMNLLAANFDFN